MNQVLRFLVFFTILVVYSSQINGQIRKIKEKSKENQENRKPKPGQKPSRTTPPNPKSTPTEKKEPVIIDYRPIIVRELINYHEPVVSYSESYDFDGCFYALGTLNPIPLFKGKK